MIGSYPRDVFGELSPQVIPGKSRYWCGTSGGGSKFTAKPLGATIFSPGLRVAGCGGMNLNFPGLATRYSNHESIQTLAEVAFGKGGSEVSC